MRTKYSDHILALCSMIYYIVRLKFKSLFWENTANIYNIYLNKHRPQAPLLQSVVDTLVASTNCCRENRTAQVILCSSFSKKQLEEVVGQLKSLVPKERVRICGDRTLIAVAIMINAHSSRLRWVLMQVPRMEIPAGRIFPSNARVIRGEWLGAAEDRAGDTESTGCCEVSEELGRESNEHIVTRGNEAEEQETKHGMGGVAQSSTHDSTTAASTSSGASTCEPGKEILR